MTLLEETVIVTSDDFELPLRRLKSNLARPTAAVLLLHGASSNADNFLHPNGGLAAYLAARGFEVWLLDWRASSLVVGNYGADRDRAFTFDAAAANDIPAALSHIRGVSQCEHLAALGHCIGGVCLSMAIASGALAKFHVREVVLSTIGLFFRAPIESFLKAEDGILERVRAQAPDCLGIDARDGAAWPEELQRAYTSWPQSLLPGGQTPADDAYRRMTFLFGSPYLREAVAEDVHQRVAELFGSLRLRLFIHAGQSLRRGHVAPFDAPEVGTYASAASSPYLDPTHFAPTQITLVTGKSNQLWHRESIDTMYEWLRNETRGAHRKHVLSGYAHQDLLLGESAARDVYPLFAAGLSARGPALQIAPSDPHWTTNQALSAAE